MAVHVTPLRTKEQTGREMTRLVRAFADDLRSLIAADGNTPLSEYTLREFFDFVRRLPYQQDQQPVEIVCRPAHALTNLTNGLDCKKKAILIAAWCEIHGVPWRFAAVSRRPGGEIHHVIVEANIDGTWIELDATYPENRMGATPWTAKETLSGESAAWTQSPVLLSISGDTNREYAIAASRAREAGLYMGDMGVGEVIAVIGTILAAIATVTTTIVTVCAQNRQQDRQHAHDAKMALNQQQFIERRRQEELAAEEARRKAEAENQQALMQKLLLPTALAAGVVLFVST